MNNDIITELLMCEDLGSKRLLTFNEEQTIFELLKNDNNLRVAYLLCRDDARKSHSNNNDKG